MLRKNHKGAYSLLTSISETLIQLIRLHWVPFGGEGIRIPSDHRLLFLFLRLSQPSAMTLHES